MCIGFLNKFSQRLRDREIDLSRQEAIEMELMKACSEAKDKDERFVSAPLAVYLSVSVGTD